LGGALEVAFSNNSFSPAAGSLFEILRADGGVFNSFTTASLPTLDPGLGWNVIYSNFSVLLSVINSPPGDYNQNGVVDAPDYVVWRNTLGSMTDLRADGNGSGGIEAADYDVWRANFGQTGSGAVAPGSSASVAGDVPEPRSITLLFLGVAFLMPLRQLVVSYVE
jgi:hypothetical protein